MMSPGLRLEEWTLAKFLPSTSHSVGAQFISTSDLNHQNSSTPSQIIETAKTNINGMIEVAGLVGAICGIDARMAVTKKYTFASLLN